MFSTSQYSPYPLPGPNHVFCDKNCRACIYKVGMLKHKAAVILYGNQYAVTAKKKDTATWTGVLFPLIGKSDIREYYLIELIAASRILSNC